MRRCLKCGIEKPLEDYYRHPLAEGGRMTSCKECKKSYQRAKQDKFYDKARYQRNPRRRLQVIFRGIMKRCADPLNSHYGRYGGRGIKVEWKDFEEFYADMLDSYIEHRDANRSEGNCRKTTIDRINNDGNYSKENCRWVTYNEQARNRSDTRYYNGRPLADIIEERGLNYKSVLNRIYKGWTAEKALSIPLHKTRKNQCT